MLSLCNYPAYLAQLTSISVASGVVEQGEQGAWLYTQYFDDESIEIAKKNI